MSQVEASGLLVVLPEAVGALGRIARGWVCQHANEKGLTIDRAKNDVKADGLKADDQKAFG